MASKTNKLAVLNTTQIFCSVDIAEGGFVERHGSMSGNVTNNGGGCEINGFFSGEVYGDSDDHEEDYGIE